MSNINERCDYAMAVVRNAREAGMTRHEFINLVELAWDAQDMAAKNALLLAEGKRENNNG